MGKFIYIEISNRTGNISDISPYKTDYKNMPIIETLNSLDYSGFIINKHQYVNKYRYSKPNNVPSIVHMLVINNNRRNKILKLKDKIN